MKIVLTGGGSGGHFYPLIAVAQKIREIGQKEHLLDPELIYMAPTEYDRDVLFEQGITFMYAPAGKRRHYRSILNFFDRFKTAWGIFQTTIRLFFVFPDVIFSKGGYASVPVLFAARLFGIPVIIHESDSVPGRANMWAAQFAKRIAISYPEAAEAFKKVTDVKNKKATIALTGNPIRKELLVPAVEGAREFLDLEEGVPVVAVFGGSQGAQSVNEAIIEALPELLPLCYVIHQTGKEHINIVQESARTVTEGLAFKERYKPFPFLNVLAMRMVAGVADIVISRAGSGSIFEIAAWGTPSLIVPIPEDVSRDQRSNAFAYARHGSAVVIEQGNLSPHIIVSEITRLLNDTAERERMTAAAKEFARPDAAEKIAREVLDVALEHEK